MKHIGVFLVLLFCSVSLFSQKLDTSIIYREIEHKKVEIKKMLNNSKFNMNENVSIFQIIHFRYIGKINKNDFIDGKFIDKLQTVYILKKNLFNKKRFIDSDGYLFDENGYHFATSYNYGVEYYANSSERRDSTNYFEAINKIITDKNTKLVFDIYGQETAYAKFYITTTNDIMVMIMDKKKIIICTLLELTELYWSKAGFSAN